MATNSGVCHNDPNFAVICSFLDRYCEHLALPSISYAELESWLEETKRGDLPFSLFSNFKSSNSKLFFCNKRMPCSECRDRPSFEKSREHIGSACLCVRASVRSKKFKSTVEFSVHSRDRTSGSLVLM